jgi:transcription elongation factor GreB
VSDAFYITREGAKRLQAELAALHATLRPKIVAEVAEAAAQGDRSENAEYIYGKKKLREIDRRIHWLTKRLESVTVVESQTGPTSVVYFGAYVDVQDEDGGLATYRIVGEDEINLDQGEISWRSPMGRSLLKKRVGDLVVVVRPRGRAELTVVAIRTSREADT